MPHACLLRKSLRRVARLLLLLLLLTAGGALLRPRAPADRLRPPPATIIYPLTVVLTDTDAYERKKGGEGDNLEEGASRAADDVPLARLLAHPALLDVFADGRGCLHAIARGYRHVDLAAVTVDGRAMEALVNVRPLDRYAESATHLRACYGAFAPGPRARLRRVTFALGAARAHADVSVPARAAPPPRGGAALAGCTVLDNRTVGTWLAPWLAHLAAIGVGHVYAYVLEPRAALAAAVRAALPPASAAHAAARVTFVHWPFPFLLHPRLVPGAPEWGSFKVVHFGQTTALQDCGARFASRHDYLGSLDADEFPVLPPAALRVAGAAASLRRAFQAAEAARGGAANCFCLHNVWAWGGGGPLAALPRKRVALLSPPARKRPFDRTKCFLRAAGVAAAGGAATPAAGVHFGVHHPRGPGVVCATVGWHLHMVDGRERERARAFRLQLPTPEPSPRAATVVASAAAARMAAAAAPTAGLGATQRSSVTRARWSSLLIRMQDATAAAGDAVRAAEDPI